MRIAALIIAVILLASLIAAGIRALDESSVVKVINLYAASIPMHRPALAISQRNVYTNLHALMESLGKPPISVSATLFSTLLSRYFKLYPNPPLLLLSLKIGPRNLVKNGTVFAGARYWIECRAINVLGPASRISSLAIDLEKSGRVLGSLTCTPEKGCNASQTFSSPRIEVRGSEIVLNASLSIPWSVGGSVTLCAYARLDELKRSRCMRLYVVNRVELKASVTPSLTLPSQEIDIVVKARYLNTSMPVAGLEIEMNGTVIGSTNSSGVLEKCIEAPNKPGHYCLIFSSPHGGRARVWITVLNPRVKPAIAWIRLSGPTVRRHVLGAGHVIELVVGVRYPSKSVLKYLTTVVHSRTLLNATYSFSTGSLTSAGVLRVVNASFRAVNSTTGVLTLSIYVPWSVSGNHTLLLTLSTSLGSSSKTIAITVVNTTRAAIASPRVLRPGSNTIVIRITYAGTGIPAPNETVYINGTRLAADSHGIVTLSITVPRSARRIVLVIDPVHGEPTTVSLPIAASPAQGGSGALGGAARTLIPATTTVIASVLFVAMTMLVLQRRARSSRFSRLPDHHS